VQVFGYAGDIIMMIKSKRATSEVHGELKGRAKEAGLSINIGKIKEILQSEGPGKDRNINCYGSQE
jgi:hypothetical protein